MGLNHSDEELQMGELVKKEVCKCENCGNEAEMVVTCSLPDVDEKENKDPSPEPSAEPQPEKRVKGTATCTQCGNESDMWIDL
jgi:transcription elongation factor Elf1